VKTFGENRAMIGGYAICVAALGLLCFADQGWMLFPLIAAQIFGNTCAEPSLRSILSRNMPADQQGFLQGIIGSINGLVVIIGPLAASMLLANVTGPHPLIALPGIWYLIGSLLYACAFVIVFRRKAP
jgi:DHA1 family tetracycline resistance protein-like MFS transporter